MILQKMLNLLSKTNVFIKKNKFADKNWKGVISGRNISTGLQYVLVLLDRSWQVRTCPMSDFWSNFGCVGFKIGFLTKFLNDSAWFSLKKLKT